MKREMRASYFYPIMLFCICAINSPSLSQSAPYGQPRAFPGGGKAKFYRWDNGIPAAKQADWVSLMDKLRLESGAPAGGGIEDVTFPCLGYYCPDPQHPPKGMLGNPPAGVTFGPSKGEPWGAFIHKTVLCNINQHPLLFARALMVIAEEQQHKSEGGTVVQPWDTPVSPGNSRQYQIYTAYRGWRLYKNELSYLGALVNRWPSFLADAGVDASDPATAAGLHRLRDSYCDLLKFWKDCYDRNYQYLLSQLQQGPVPSSSGGAFPGYDYLVSHQQIDLDRIQRQNRFAQRMAQRAQAFFCN